MLLAFNLDGLDIVATYTPAVRGRRSGHPDSWTEGESEEIEIQAVCGVDPGRSARRWRRRAARVAGRRRARRIPELPSREALEHAVRAEYEERLAA